MKQPTKDKKPFAKKNGPRKDKPYGRESAVRSVRTERPSKNVYSGSFDLVDSFESEDRKKAEAKDRGKGSVSGKPFKTDDFARGKKKKGGKSSKGGSAK